MRWWRGETMREFINRLRPTLTLVPKQETPQERKRRQEAERKRLNDEIIQGLRKPKPKK